METDEKELPMFIIGNLMFENVLIWPENVKDQFPDFVDKECSHMGTYDATNK